MEKIRVKLKKKDPLLVLLDVLAVNSDEEIIRALRNQNRGVFCGLDKDNDRIQVKFRKRVLNPIQAM
ncbi:unnamed protein product [Arctia plantaginis]|uniref:Uncharacterized protein n=1 Tax=Arctia plantaginis TaxID=874455 RepID=A0A8S1BPL7_ARCPL|nr:unnamed protein product [Arctia plantaginis]